jgi:hypothetical protein
MEDGSFNEFFPVFDFVFTSLVFRDCLWPLELKLGVLR